MRDSQNEQKFSDGLNIDGQSNAPGRSSLSNCIELFYAHLQRGDIAFLSMLVGIP